jgi:hypothetical protein
MFRRCSNRKTFKQRSPFDGDLFDLFAMLDFCHFVTSLQSQLLSFLGNLDAGSLLNQSYCRTCPFSPISTWLGGILCRVGIRARRRRPRGWRDLGRVELSGCQTDLLFNC